MTIHIEAIQKRGARAYQQNLGADRSSEVDELEKIVEEFSPLVRRIARRLARGHGGAMDVDDLTSVGVIGLIDAHRRYDPAGGREFRVYAEYRIRGAILDELRRLDPMTQPMRRRARALDAARRSMATQLGREPSEQELAEHFGVSLDKMQAELNELQPKNFVPVTDVDDIRPDLASLPQDRVSLKASLISAIESLSERSQQVMTLYYVHDLTLREIGEVLGVTEARVCQLHKAAIADLRAHLQQDEGIP